MPHTPECVNYYKYIREEIRRFLKRYYTNEYREGDVMVSFVLAQNGQLTSLNIVNNRSSDDPGLRSLSYKSIQSAAPFKPFPKNLDQKEISFNLSILFKKS
jgi:TonB family protein